MKFSAALFCFTPWIVFSVLRLDGVAKYQIAYDIFPFVWIVICPFLTAIGLLVAYTEGCRSSIEKDES